MDAPERGALMLVRFVAITLMGWTLADLALYWVICQHNHVDMKITVCVVKSLPLLAGLVVLVKARALAEWVADKLDL
jgi:hypothetical protein